MGPQSFATFQQLLNIGHYPPRIGFGAKVKAADVNRFANRFRLARSFQGIRLNGYSEETVAGYSAFCQVLLTHSALERFMEINAFGKKLDVLGPLMTEYHPETVIHEFASRDKKDILFDFLHEKVEHGLKDRLHECRYGISPNVAYLSASLRHIFAHGHLCAHTNGINPRSVDCICTCVSEFLLHFMDAEFTRKVENYHEKIKLT